MLEIIKQLALDAAEKGADFCVGTVTKAALGRKGSKRQAAETIRRRRDA